MNFRELEYLLKLEEEKNVTKAAQKLFVTPSALNQHLHKLEDEIGTPLFLRTDEGWVPTEAGEVYLDASKKILNIKKNAYNLLSDIAITKRGTLTIGIPPERATNMFTSVYPIFHKEFPDMTINLIEQSVNIQQKLVTSGKIDIGFVTLIDKQKTNNNYIHIKDEELFLAVPAVNPVSSLSTISEDAPFPYLDLKYIKDEPFAIMYKDSTFRESVDKIFQEAQIEPNIIFETSRPLTILNMVSANMCCSIVHSNAVNNEPKNVNIFCLKNRPTWQICATYKKGNYLSKPAKRFIELATEYWLSQECS